MDKTTLKSFREIRSLHKEKMITESEFRRILMNITIKKMNLDFERVIGSGTFGDVISVKAPDCNSNVAVKLVTTENLGFYESEWDTLKHPNILKLLQKCYIPRLDLHLFITPVEENTLQELLKSKDFRNDYGSYSKIIRWIRSITSVLEYMHERRFCYLNINTSNILISKDMSAKVFDFHYISRIDNHTKK